MRKASEKTTEVTRKLTAQFMPKLEQLLSPDQLQRLKEIQLQASGLDLWTEPESPRNWICPTSRSSNWPSCAMATAVVSNSSTATFSSVLRKFASSTPSATTKALELLTSAQKEKLTALKGSPFDVSQLGFGRRRGNN